MLRNGKTPASSELPTTVSEMNSSEIRWNGAAREKIRNDADRVLREAVLDIANGNTDLSSDEVFAQLNSRLKTRFIDYEPGPDIRKYADAIAAGEISATAN